MGDYTQATDFSAKDLLADSNPEKKILGSDMDAELALISTAIASKAELGTAETVTADWIFSEEVTFQKEVTFKKGDYVASANAMTLGDGTYFDITGTTTVNTIATKGIGTRVVLHFDGALQLTHHASDMVLPGGANITTAAGDIAVLYEYASGDWRCVSYSRASGQPVGVTSTITELNYNDTGAAVGTVVASKTVTADANKDVSSFRNVTLTGELDAATLDISGDADIDGITNLDAVDIDGAVQIDNTVTVGVDDTGHDVKFFGATAGHYLHWDESDDALILYGELQTPTAGTSNLALGVDAGIAIASGGNYNVLIGDNAGEAITTGVESVAVGYDALKTNTEANYNTAVGASALEDATDAHSCVAVGRGALAVVTTGVYNIAIGRDAADALTVGERNVAIGAFALDAETTSDQSTAVGYAALGAQANVSNVNANNTAVGYSSGPAITTGRYNTMIGSHSGMVLSTGNDNTYLGYSNSASAGDVTDEVVIGRDCTGAGDNTARFGYAGHTATLNIDGSDTSWAAASDERLKTQIKSCDIGLDFIYDLRPITYRFRAQKDVPTEMSQYDPDSDEVCNGSGKTNHGFIAQEVKQAIDSHNLADGHNIWSEDPSGTQQIAPGNFMPMAIRAIQELSEKVTMLEEKIQQYENM